MSTDKVDSYMEKTFPGLKLEPPLFYNWPVGIRFEIGYPYRGIDDPSYFVTVATRSTLLFEEVFSEGDEILLSVNSYKCLEPYECLGQGEEVLPNFLRNKQLVHHIETVELEKHFEEDGVQSGTSYRKSVICQRSDFDYKRLLQAIGNQDFAREPWVSDEVYFININKKLIYHLYDDRGLDIVASAKCELLPIYQKYNEWILDYDRERIQKVFED